MKRLWQVCGISHVTLSPYHPQMNELVEKFNGTLMRIICVYVAENPNDWDNKLQPLLYAYQDITQESTGHKVRGPLDFLLQNWEDYKERDPVVEYMDNLMNNLQRSLEIAGENLK